MNRKLGCLIAVVALLVLLTIGFFVCFKITTIEGNQLGVLETWGNGVQETALSPEHTFCLDGLMTSIHMICPHTSLQ